MERASQKTSGGFETKHLRHTQIIGPQALGVRLGAPPPGSASEHFVKNISHTLGEVSDANA